MSLLTLWFFAGALLAQGPASPQTPTQVTIPPAQTAPAPVVVPSPGKDRTEKDQKPGSTSRDYSKEAYVIERYLTRLSAENDGTGTREMTAEVKMLAEAGVKAFAVLNFTYTSANEVVDVDYVRVRKPDGTVVKTPDYNIQDLPGEVTRAAPLYSDIHEKHVAVKGLAVGDVLEYLVRIRVIKPEVPGHFWFEHSFTDNAIIKDERLEISVPANKYVKIVSPDFKPQMTEEGGRRIYRWTHSNLEVKEKDPMQIPRRIPPNPAVQLTTFANWEEVGSWYAGLQKEALEVTPAIQAKAAELTKGLKTDDEKFRAIYNFVSLQFHYIGLDFGIGRYQPHAADDVLGNGYGDCKDKHTLMASLLKAAGYDAWPVLIHTARKLDPEVPSPAQFNHVITVIPNGDQLIWLDSTPEVAPYQLLIQALRNKQALLIPTGKTALLATTPPNPPFPQDQQVSVKGKLGSDGVFTGHVELSYRGDSEVLLRMVFRQVSQSHWKETMQRFSYGLGFGGEVNNVVVSPPGETDEPLEISYDYLRKNFGDWDNHHTIAPLPQMGIEVTKDSIDRKPLEPVLLGAPGKVIYRSRLELPAGYSMTPPVALNLVEPYAEYHTTNTLTGGVLITTRELVIKKSEVTLSDWEGFRKFGRAIGDDEFGFMPFHGNFGVTVSGGSSENKSGYDLDQEFRDGIDAARRLDWKEAETSFEKVIAGQPDYPLVHLKLGTVLLLDGKVEPGLVQFHKQQELSPDNLSAFDAPANLLELMGQRDDAIGELRRLLKVHPQNNAAALRLGALLGLEGKGTEAAEVLETALSGSPHSPDLQFALGSAYLKTGQADKALSHIQTAVDEGGAHHDPMMLNNAAYALAESDTNLELAKQYAEESLQQLEKRSITDVAAEDTGTRVTFQISLVWDTLGWVYFQSGDVGRAESLVRSAWLLGQNAIVGEHLGEIYEKQGKKVEAAHTYELALATLGLSPQVPSWVKGSVPFKPTDVNQEQRDKITSRYRNLTGKDPASRELQRLPPGQWIKTPTDELSQMRTTHLGKMPKLTGSAEFSVVFVPGRVESVEYLRGENSLTALADNLKASKYQVEFPSDSKGKLYRRAILSCTPSAGCVAVLMPPDAAMPRQNASNLAPSSGRN
jgi:tetratricopeptide (TPR) repeat protein/transglutaminase-like putative cysteine protease